MTPAQRSSPNVVAGRGGHAPNAIVLHTTTGTALGTVPWFASPKSQVSSHYLVALDGAVVQFADEGDSARHAGRVARPTWPLLEPEVSPNLHTIGIDFEDGGDPFDARRTEEQYCAGAALVAEVTTRWAIPIDALHVITHNEINGDKFCPVALDIDRLRTEASAIARAWASPAPLGRKRAAPRLLSLTPARNAAQDLPQMLDSLWPACDGVLALDDGSTDGTAAVLSAHPLVHDVLRNPPRASWAGWHDGANRNRLLRAAGDLDPDWVVFIDADELLSPVDAERLRRLVDDDLDPAAAYGLRCVRMWGTALCEPTFRWVYRLFAYRPGLTLPTGRLHFDPVPVSIPRDRWIGSDVRIQHLGASSFERMERRRRKYEESDPTGRHAAALALDGEPRDLVAWRDQRTATART